MGTRKIQRNKGCLPLGTALKIGGRNFRKHPIRTAATALLAAVAFSFLGLSLTLYAYDPAETQVSLLAEYGQREASFVKCRYYPDPSKGSGAVIEQILGGSAVVEEEIPMTREDEERIERKTGLQLSLIYESWVDNNYGNTLPAATTEEINKAAEETGGCYFSYFNGYITMSEAECAARGWEIEGRLPRGTEEVAVNNCFLNALTLAGMRTEEGVIPIADASDLIGRQIPVVSNSSERTNYKTVTGVVFTGERTEDAKHGYCEYRHKIFVDYGYIPDSLFGSRAEGYERALVTFSGDRAEYERAVGFVCDARTEEGGYKLSAEALSGYGSANDRLSLMKNLFLYAAAFFFVIDVLLLFNFVTASVNGQLKQVGTLVALGAGKGDLFAIYGATAVLLSGGAGVLACAATGACIPLINGLLTERMALAVRMILPRAWIFVLLIALAAATAAAGAWVSMRIATRAAPAEIIRRGQRK